MRAIQPIIADTISASILESRDEMIDALYPIALRMVSRAVAEAFQELARNVDNQMRSTFSLDSVMRRIRARASGVTHTQMTMRNALPSDVEEVFLIHRESGLLIQYVSSYVEETSDSDLVSGMLTAIRDFARDAFGRGQDGQLDVIQYGDKRILIEVAEYVYMAVVVDGFESSGFRTALHEEVFEIDREYRDLLKEYDGDAAPLATVRKRMELFLQAPVIPAVIDSTASEANRMPDPAQPDSLPDVSRDKDRIDRSISAENGLIGRRQILQSGCLRLSLFSHSC